MDIGTADRFLEQGQLEPKALENAAEVSGRGKGEVEVRMQEGFDHSYYFVSGFLSIQVEMERTRADDRFRVGADLDV